MIFGVGPETGRSLGNPKQPRKRGRAAGESSSQNANGKKKRATPKCGVCGRKGHNRVSCRFHPEATIPSETDSSISNYEQEIYDDNEDWKVHLVCMKLLLYYF